MPLVPLPPQSAHYTWDDLVEDHGAPADGLSRGTASRRIARWFRICIEETYEVVEAIETGDLDALCEELGDLLLQIVFHSQIATETGKFGVADVVDALSNKMVRRHPHVFGDAVIEDVDAQWRNWEKLKALEKTGLTRKSRLDGIPKHLGALQRGQRMQEKASRVGFDWPNVEGILEKLGRGTARTGGSAPRKAGRPARPRGTRRRILYHREPLARARHRRRNGDAPSQRKVLPTLLVHGRARRRRTAKPFPTSRFDELEELWQLAKTQAA